MRIRHMIWPVAALMLSACAPSASPPVMTTTVGTSGLSEDYYRNLERADDVVDDARRSGSISRSEARQYEEAQSAVGSIGDRLSSDGLSEWEAREMENHARVLADTTQSQILIQSAE